MGFSVSLRKVDHAAIDRVDCQHGIFCGLVDRIGVPNTQVIDLLFAAVEYPCGNIYAISAICVLLPYTHERKRDFIDGDVNVGIVAPQKLFRTFVSD